MDELEERNALPVLEKRREKRTKYVSQLSDMQKSRQETSDLNSNKFDHHFNQYLEISKDTEFTRELQYDASCLTELSVAVRNQASSMNDFSIRCSLQTLSTDLKRRFRTSDEDRVFDWTRCGQFTRSMFSSIPAFATMLGPLHKEIKVRQVRQRQKGEAALTELEKENMKAKMVYQDDDDEKEQEATNERVQKLIQVVKDLSKENASFDVLQTLIDPMDPIQSIENMFDFSFLVKVSYYLFAFITDSV